MFQALIQAREIVSAISNIALFLSESAFESLVNREYVSKVAAVVWIDFGPCRMCFPLKNHQLSLSRVSSGAANFHSAVELAVSGVNVMLISGIEVVDDVENEKPVETPPVGPDELNPAFAPILKPEPVVKLVEPQAFCGLQ